MKDERQSRKSSIVSLKNEKVKAVEKRESSKIFEKTQGKKM